MHAAELAANYILYKANANTHTVFTWYCWIIVLRSARICSPSSRASFSFLEVTASWDLLSYEEITIKV